MSHLRHACDTIEALQEDKGYRVPRYSYLQKEVVAFTLHRAQEIVGSDFWSLFLAICVTAREVNFVIDWASFTILLVLEEPRPISCVCKEKWNLDGATSLPATLQSIQDHLQTHTPMLCPSEVRFGPGCSVAGDFNGWVWETKQSYMVLPGRWSYVTRGADGVITPVQELLVRTIHCSCGTIADLDHASTKDHAVKAMNGIMQALGYSKPPPDIRLKGKKMFCDRCGIVIGLSAETLQQHLNSSQHQKSEPPLVDAQNSVCALCGVSLDSPEHASTHATAEKALPLNSSAILTAMSTYQHLVQPAPNFSERRKKFMKSFQNLIRNVVPDAVLVMFGSTVTGLAEKTSDLDVCLLTNSNESPEVLLTKIRDHLRDNLISCVLIAARVPILQFKRTKTKAFFVQPFDLCINNNMAVRNSHYVAEMVRYDYRIKPLVRYSSFPVAFILDI